MRRKAVASIDRDMHVVQAAKGGRRKRGVLDSLQENAAVEATPAPADRARMVPFPPAVAATVMRAPRLGEMFYSQTGSLAGHTCTLSVHACVE